MKSAVTIQMVGGLKYAIVMSTVLANVFTKKMARVWRGEPQKIDELVLADGSRVVINPAHVIAVEVR